MNLLLFDKGEVSDAQSLSLAGERAKHLISVKKVAVGDVIEVGELDGRRGRGVVTQVTRTAVELELELELELDLGAAAFWENPIDLLLALPRPQILKKVLFLAGMLGVRRLDFLRSQKVEKSFFGSSVLEPDSLQRHLKLGMAQGMVTRMPLVSVHRRFKPFLEDVFEEQVTAETLRLLAHPAAQRNLSDVINAELVDVARPIVLAIGPEGGWTDFEVERFVDSGFHSFEMGERVLRVEYAVAILIGQIELLKKQGRSKANNG